MEPPSVSPLEILLTLMRQHWKDKEYAAAVALAKVAAPFVHPRARASRAFLQLAEAADDELDPERPAGGADAAARDTGEPG